MPRVSVPPVSARPLGGSIGDGRGSICALGADLGAARRDSRVSTQDRVRGPLRLLLETELRATLSDAGPAGTRRAYPMHRGGAERAAESECLSHHRERTAESRRAAAA